MSKCSKGPACDGQKVFIEVSGVAHSPEHSLLIYDETNMEQQAWLESKQEKETLQDSVVYSWDWKEQPKLNFWLGVEGEKGKIILPLFEQLEAHSRKKDMAQDNLLLSVFPSCFIPHLSYKNPEKHLMYTAPVRPGYLYFFYQGKVWREIEVVPGDTGVEMRDVDLLSYREDGVNTKPFKEEDRQATGNPLKEIWLPARRMGKKLGSDVRFAFSEVQWSPAYLSFLEANLKYQKERLEPGSLLDSWQPNYIAEAEDELWHAGLLIPMRPRDLCAELHTSRPIKYLKDLQGNAMQLLYSEAHQEFLDYRAGGQKAVGRWGKSEDGTLYLEVATRANLLDKENNNNREKPRQINDEPWREAGGAEDVYTDAKARKLCVLRFRDRLFEVRHICTQIGLAQEYLQLLLEAVEQDPHSRSAQLVHQTILVEKFGKKENPYHKHEKLLDPFLGGRFKRLTRDMERGKAHGMIATLQEQLGKLLKRKDVAANIRDITSLEGHNPLVAYSLCSRVINMALFNSHKLDYLIQEKDKQKKSVLQDEIQRLLEMGSSHPLHPVILPPVDLEAWTRDLEVPEAKNDGSGLATPENIARWSTESGEPDASKFKSIDMNLLLGMANAPRDFFSEQRRIANFVDASFHGFVEGLQDLLTTLQKHSIKVDFDKLFLPVATLGRHAFPDYLAPMQFRPSKGMRLEGYFTGADLDGVKFGVPNPDNLKPEEYQYKTGSNNRAYGTLRDGDGNTMATTNSRYVKGSSAVTKVKAGGSFFFIPKNGKLADVSRKIAEFKLGNKIETSFKGLRIPFFLMIFEFVNVKREIAILTSKNNPAIARSMAGVFSASLDLGVMAFNTAKLYNANYFNLVTRADKVLYAFSETSSSNLVQKLSNVKWLNQSYTRLAGAGFVAGGLTAGLAAYDAVQLYYANDVDASAAMFAVAVGVGVSTLGGTFVASGALGSFLGMGPIGWIGLAIALTGGLLYLYFVDSPLEKYLKNGPFGKQDDKDKDASLSYLITDPEKGFYHLANLFVGLDIQFHKLSEVGKLPELMRPSSEEIQALEKQNVDTCISVTNNLASLLSMNTKEVCEYVAIREAAQTDTISAGMMGSAVHSSRKQVATTDSRILASKALLNGHQYFVGNAKKLGHSGDSHSTYLGSSISTTLGWKVKAQLQINDWLFPAPANLNSTASGVQKKVPDFDKDDQDFWLVKDSFGS